MRIVQFVDEEKKRRVGIVRGAETVDVLRGTWTVYALVQQALRRGTTLATLLDKHPVAQQVAYVTLAEERRLLPPLDHPDPAHMLISGTGLTHLGSADARDRMHKTQPETLTDSMKMFQLGLEGGRPAPGNVGVQPEWFYKGDGSWVVPPYGTLSSPAFALDGGEEPEIVGLYVIGPNGLPYRVGFALGNEFSDHVMERQNYLYLAHSKLRPCAFGPELRLGELPRDIRGVSRILRNGRVLWEKPFLSGEDNMSHTIANLEYHHFKYPQFRRPGDVHVHFFGTATLSFADGVRLESGDEIEITAPAFGHPLRNRVTFGVGDDFGMTIL
ncbi:MAG TPA: GguC family protein [Anaerolineae bacterium]|nr:GguC family protein [Anaerolineae bacterium]HQK12752.1 GguC family protein [Anaerolineae bacterium]